jgi:putative holliday junction resolvase
MHSDELIVLGIDFGLARIGVAVGNTASCSARALVTLPARAGLPDWRKVGVLLDDWSVGAFVVGLPLNKDGTSQGVTKLAQKFAKLLEARFDLPVYLTDERYTSAEARTMFQEFSRLKQKRIGLDAVAAQLILEQWLDDY